MDGIILIGKDAGKLEVLKNFLAREFEIKDLEAPRYFLGMEFARSKGIFVSRRKYVLDLLKETGLLGCKPVGTLMVPNLRLQPASVDKVVNRDQDQRLVGRLIYLSHTRPIIAFAVSVVSQYMHSLGEEHFEVVYQILKYLKRKLGKGLLFENHDHSRIEAYTDADWASIID